ncbi:hypothetical protein [Albibacterium profundi]|uniref:ATP synthase protein I n=1 Tax=Albibacterium profundi TaxID=3134906 RepID=A0ABV5CCN9_9SPHI
MSIVKFILYFSLFAIFVFGLPYGLSNVIGRDLVSEYYIPLFVFLFVLTTIVYVLSFFGIKKGGQTSVLALLGGLTLKMIFSLAMVLMLLLKGADNQKVLAGNFFYIYFLFTLFEVICLLRNLRDQNKM